MTRRAKQTGRDDSAPRLGRRIATILFWICALYIVTVGFYSIPPQVFRPTAAATAPASSCAQGVSELRAELLGRASERVATGGTDEPSSLRRWLDDWDARHAALSEHCGGRARAPYTALARLRQRMESTLRRFDWEQAPLNRDIDRGLRSLTDH